MTRGRSRRALFLLALVLALYGCGHLDLIPYSAYAEQTPHDGAVLYHAAIRTLVRSGYGFASRDEGAMAMETEYRTVSQGAGPGSTSYRYSWRIITVDGELSVYASCFYIEFGPGRVEQECGSGRPQALVNEQANLVEAILEDARERQP